MAGGQSAKRCPSCGSGRGVVFVHGHGQCVACGGNTEPCCAGASAADEADGGDTHGHHEAEEQGDDGDQPGKCDLQ